MHSNVVRTWLLRCIFHVEISHVVHFPPPPLLIIGRGVFASCPNSNDPGCIDDAITVPRGGIGVLDTRVTFRDGGPCANQGVRVLRVTRERQPGVFVYLCSNLAGFQGEPCTNELYPRFTVVDAGGCSPQVACKYNIFLYLTNFNDSDVDVYSIEVIFELLGDTMQRMLRRRISLQIDIGMYWDLRKKK